jgi:hypothetical protein
MAAHPGPNSAAIGVDKPRHGREGKMMRNTTFIRRDALKLSGLAAALGLFGSAASAAEGTEGKLPKSPKIAPPPGGDKGEDENKAEEDLHAAEMIGLQLRVVRPGQVVTQEYNEGRLTITVDKNSVITDIRIG